MLVMAKRNLDNAYGQRLFSQGGVYEAKRDGKRVWILNELHWETPVRTLDADFEIVEDFDAPCGT